MAAKIYTNGPIITMENDGYPEAVAVEGARITGVGDLNELRADNEIIDLCGKTLMPAFIDAHSHLTAFASSLSLISLSDAKNFDDIVAKLTEFKDTHDLKGKWIIGSGYDHNFIKEGKHPDRAVLDQVSEDIPIVISHASGHMGVANTAALRAAGITETTPDPQGGIIGRSPDTGKLNGYLEESAFVMMTAKVPSIAIEDMYSAINKAQDIYLSYGITTVQDGKMMQQEFDVLKFMSDSGRLKVDVVGYVDMDKSSETLTDNRSAFGHYHNRLKIGGYKIFLDGSPQGRTAWMTKPYEHASDGYRGYPIHEDRKVTEFAEKALRDNIQLLAHCNGDAAADQYIRCFEEARRIAGSNADIRPVMIHAQTVRKDQVAAMACIGMIPSYFVAHVYYWGDIHLANLGVRAESISPVATSIRDGIIYTFHQDTPVVMPDMLHTVWCAVNRLTRSGQLLGPEERISVYDALKAVTINAAYQYFEENEKGSIKEGKVADLILLNKDPLKTDKAKIKDIKVLATIKSGETVYEKNR